MIVWYFANIYFRTIYVAEIKYYDLECLALSTTPD